eukprot:3654066-Lingulodinium_polyedra.AAC.1
MANSWPIHGRFMANAWPPIHGQTMASSRPIHEQFMSNSRGALRSQSIKQIKQPKIKPTELITPINSHN